MTSETIRHLQEIATRLEDDARPERALGELLASLAHRPVPTGRLARLWSLGGLHASLAMGYAGLLLKSPFLGEAEKERLRRARNVDAAIELVSKMGYLRGMVLKVGQLLATFPNLLPQEAVSVVSSMCFEVPPMHYALVREQLHNGLGAPPEEVFASFEQRAFAAASLGQVHRARLEDGTAVAVKVQYPGIGATIDADLRNLRALLAPMRLMGDWDNLLEKLEDLRETLVRESDYVAEADATRAARESLAIFDDVAVPRVFDAFSSERVLVTELLDGDHVGDYLARGPDEADRARRLEQLTKALDHMLYTDRMVYADPNPGNFLFLPDGRLGLIDFGCCRRFDDDEWDMMVATSRELRAGSTGYDAVLRRGCLMTEEEMRDPERVALMTAFFDWFAEPFRSEVPYRVDAAYVRRGIEFLDQLTRRRYVRSMPVTTWTNRLFYGTRGLFAQLDAPADYRGVHEAELVRAGILPGA